MGTIRGEQERVSVELQKPVVGTVINRNFKVICALGEGGFGAVFEVMDIHTKERYAMKMELVKQLNGDSELKIEGTVLRRLQGYQHILRYVSEGEWGPAKHLFLVMELAGPSLATLRKSAKHQRFTNSTTVRVGAQSLSAIEIVHMNGLLHRDIKPANFTIGHAGDARRTVYILDFGLARQHFLPNGQVRPERRFAGFCGTVQYASVRAHNKLDLGRCDDIWCWLHMMVQLGTGGLPWDSFSSNDTVGLIKKYVQKAELIGKMEPEFSEIYDKISTLQYADLPPYADFHVSLSKIMERKQINVEDPFDWER